MQGRLRQAREPDLVRKAEPPARSAPGQSDQPVASVCVYAGSELVSQGLARRQRTFSRCNACRIVSIDNTVGLRPCSWATRARRARVHVLRAKPKARGDWCTRARSCASLAPFRIGTALLGRDDPALRAARPVALKAWMALRTVWGVQRKPCAISRGRCPAALAKRIWARRSVKALGARRLAWSRA